MIKNLLRLVLVVLVGTVVWMVRPCLGGENVVGDPPRGSFSSPHYRPMAMSGWFVFIANTPNNTLDVVDSRTLEVVKEIPVGIDPVSVAIRPDGQEVWVSNHVSDSVSVVDNDPNSLTRWNVIATIQDFDQHSATRFDEPVGIAFANDEKAYVALSSENQIAVVDVATRRIVRRLNIPAQDPRAIAVKHGKLFVLPFESNNQTQLSGGSGNKIDGDLVTFDAWQHSILNNNVLSLGHVVDIVKHPEVPDRDLFVFDTETDELVHSVKSLGTLLYGLAINTQGAVFVAQTDARNDVNGRAGTQKHGLGELENRPFLNQITRVDFRKASLSPTSQRWDLEPLPPHHPEADAALATPYAVEISQDDSVLVATAAGSDRLVTIDGATGQVLGMLDVGGVPRGLVLEHAQGVLKRGWVLNAVENSVSVVDLSDARQPKHLHTLGLEDPTAPELKRGRLAFETAKASSTKTFSCSSCHPDGHTDQLLWVLKTPVVSGGDQIMPRSTMPVRGLRDTEPYHWDGIPGDPYGGNNSANVHGDVPANSVEGDALSSIRNLIDGGLSSTMVFVGEHAKNDAGKAGFLSEAERDDMGAFLLSVPYPPAQRRPYTNEVTKRARRGFELFHVLGDDDPSKPRPNVCGDCHRMPFLVSTNTPGTGMDAPTWRGAYDRFLILPQGRLNLVEFPFYREVAERGQSEQEIWRFSWGGRERFNPVWDMVLEMSTGVSGAFGRQVTLDAETIKDSNVLKLWRALETASLEQAIELTGVGARLDSSEANSVHVRLTQDGRYQELTTEAPWSREELLREIRQGRLLLTLTGGSVELAVTGDPQPAIWTLGPIEKQRGRQKFPVVDPEHLQVVVSGRHLVQPCRIFLDGRRVEGDVQWEDERVTVELAELPEEGLHLLQLQNPDGQFTNDFILTSAATSPTKAKKQETNTEKTGETLGEILKRTEWEALLGDWVDEGSNGKGLKFSVQWRLKNRVLESQSVSPDQESLSMIGVNAADGKVFQVGADDQGGSHLGSWEFRKQGPAILTMGYTSGDGNQGELTLRYQLVEQDRLVLTIQLPNPITVRLKRVK